MARNLAERGVWGGTPHEFSSSSSWPLWTALLAGVYRLDRVRDRTPLILNVLAGIAALAVVQGFANRNHWPQWWTAVVLLAIIVATPLQVIIAIGMEHTLQVALSIALLAVAIQGLSTPRSQSSRKFLIVIAMLAAATEAVRYESLLLIFAICLAAAWNRQWQLALAVTVGGLASIAGYAAWSIDNGSLWAPNSVLLKSGIEPNWFKTLIKLTGFLAIATLGRLPNLAICLAGWLFGWILVSLKSSKSAAPAACDTTSEAPNYDVTPYPPSGSVVTILFLTVFLHLTFAKTGWLFRYEAYLLALVVFGCGVLLAPCMPRDNTIKKALVQSDLRQRQSDVLCRRSRSRTTIATSLEEFRLSLAEHGNRQLRIAFRASHIPCVDGRDSKAKECLHLAVAHITGSVADDLMVSGHRVNLPAVDPNFVYAIASVR